MCGELVPARRPLLVAAAVTLMLIGAMRETPAPHASIASYSRLAQYSPDGRSIVGPALLGSTITAWDAQSGALRYVLEGHTDRAYTVRYSRDGRRIVSGAYDGTARIWDAITGKLIRTLDCRPGWPIAASFSPSGDRVLTIGSSYDRALGVYVTAATMWDAANGVALFSIQDLGPAGIVDAAFASDGRTLVTRALANREVRVYDARWGTLRYRLGGHRASIFGILVSPDGRHVMTMGSDLASKMWDVTTGRLLYTFSVRGTATSFAEFSPDGRRVLTSDFDSTARIWDVESGTLLHALSGHTATVSWSHFSADGSLVVTPSYDHTARVWNAKTGALVHVLRGHENIVTSAEFDPTGQRVITAGHDETAKVWSVRTGALLYSIGIPNTDDFDEKLGGFELRPDGAQLIIPMMFHDIRVFDAATGTRQFTLKPDADAASNVR